MTNYIVEQTDRGISLVREYVEGKTIIYAPGLSTADPENSDRPRDKERFLEKFLNPMTAVGKIDDGTKTPYDDRKFRFHAANLGGGILELCLGITHYTECADCRKWSSEKRAELIERGREMFDEPYAFFTKGCGVEVTPITSDGHIFVGKRQTEDNSYFGELAAINGWVDYKEDLKDVDFQQDAVRELREEYGVLEKDIDKLIFSGVFSSLSNSDTDFVYLAPLKITDGELLKKYEKRQDKEHGELIKIANSQEMKELLETRKLPGIEKKCSILYSLRASLEQIKPEEMVD